MNGKDRMVTVRRMTLSATCVAVFAALVGLLSLTHPARAALPTHIEWADKLIADIAPENNLYASSPYHLTWKGVNGATISSNRTRCSSFLTLLLQQTYGWSEANFKSWMGSRFPNAATYYDRIAVSGEPFTRIDNVKDIQPGDILAVKYLGQDQENADSSGHVMVVKTAPTQLSPALQPTVANTLQYQVGVIDSAKSGHGPTDTRRYWDGSSWESHDGVGEGVARLYTDGQGSIKGYTWSTFSDSTYYDETTRPLNVGRVPQQTSPGGPAGSQPQQQPINGQPEQTAPLAKTPSVKIGRRTAVRGRRASLRVNCVGQSGACLGSLVLTVRSSRQPGTGSKRKKARTVRLGKVSFRLKAGQTSTFRIKVPNRIYKLFSKKRKVRVKVVSNQPALRHRQLLSTTLVKAAKRR